MIRLIVVTLLSFVITAFPLDSLAGKSDEVEAMNNLTEALKDYAQLLSAGHDERASSVAAALEREEVKKYFENMQQTATNTAAGLNKLEGIEKGVTRLGEKFDAVMVRIHDLEVSDGKQEVKISSVKEQQGKVESAIVWAIGVLIAGGYAGHRFAHKDDVNA